MSVLAPTSSQTSSARLIVDRLDAEWATIDHHHTPVRWAGIPGLSGCATLGDVHDRLLVIDRDQRQPALADAALHGLLTAHIDDGDQLAGRVVLQRMLGRVVTLSQRAYRPKQAGIRGTFAHVMELAVAALWDAIATFPVHRRDRKIGANLAMETLSRLTKALRVFDAEQTDTTSLDDVGDVEAPETVTDAGLELLRVLAWGIDAGVISRDDASLLTRVYCPAPGQVGGAAVASELGVSWAAARKRCSRAIGRLAAAARAVNDGML